jgi:hypothetical protein
MVVVFVSKGECSNHIKATTSGHGAFSRDVTA